MFPNTQFSGSGQGKPRVRLTFICLCFSNEHSIQRYVFCLTVLHVFITARSTPASVYVHARIQKALPEGGGGGTLQRFLLLLFFFFGGGGGGYERIQITL